MNGLLHLCGNTCRQAIGAATQADLGVFQPAPARTPVDIPAGAVGQLADVADILAVHAGSGVGGGTLRRQNVGGLGLQTQGGRRGISEFAYHVDVLVGKAPAGAAVKAGALVDVGPACEQGELGREPCREGVARGLATASQNLEANGAATWSGLQGV